MTYPNSNPGQQRIPSEQEHLAVVQAPEHKRVEQINGGGDGPGHKSIGGRRAKRHQSGHEEQAENKQLAGPFTRDNSRCGGQDRLCRGGTGELDWEIESALSTPVGTKYVRAAQPGTCYKEKQSSGPDRGK